METWQKFNISPPKIAASSIEVALWDSYWNEFLVEKQSFLSKVHEEVLRDVPEDYGKKNSVYIIVG